MKAKQLLVWVFILAAAAAAYYLSEMAADKSEQALKESKKVVRLDEPLKVMRVEFSGSDYAEPIRLERRPKEHRWVITSPLDYPADSLAVGAVIDRMFAIRSQAALEKPGPLSEYGLEKPGLRLGLMDPQGFKSELLVGNTTPDGSQVYAKVPQSDSVLLLAAGEKGQLARTLFQLRDKAVLDFIINDVTGIELASRGEKLALIRKKGGAQSRWEFTDGVEASSDEVESLLSRFHGLRALGFVDKGMNPAKMGLEPAKGALSLTLTDRGKAGSAGLLLGGPAENGRGLYLRRASGGPVIKVEKGAEELWATTRFDLTERRMFRLDRSDIESLDIKRNGTRLAFAKTGSDWKRIEPKGDGKAGMAGSMFTWELADLKWRKILTGAENLLANPRAVISFSVRDAPPGGGKTDAKKKYVLTIGQKDPDTGLLAVKSEGGDRVYGIKADFWDKMPVYPEAEKAPGPKAAPEAPVKKD